MHDDVAIAEHMDRFMRRFHTGMHTRAQTTGADTVGLQGGLILRALAERDAQPIQALVQNLARDKSQMTRKVRELEELGLVTRGRDPSDARVSLLILSDKGRALHDRLKAEMVALMGEILAPLVPDERRALLALLEKL